MIGPTFAFQFSLQDQIDQRLLAFLFTYWDLIRIQIQPYLHFENSGSREPDRDVEEKQKEHHPGIIPNCTTRHHHDKDLDDY